MRLSLPSFLIILSLLIDYPLIKSEEKPPGDPESEKQLSGDTDPATGPDFSPGSGAGEESGQLGHSADSGDGMYAHSHSILSYSILSFFFFSLSLCPFTSLPHFLFFRRRTREKK